MGMHLSHITSLHPCPSFIPKKQKYSLKTVVLFSVFLFSVSSNLLLYIFTLPLRNKKQSQTIQMFLTKKDVLIEYQSGRLFGEHFALPVSSGLKVIYYQVLFETSAH